MHAPKLLTVDEVAELLNVAPTAVRHMVNRRQIPFIRIGERRLRFDQDAIVAWVQAQRVEVAG